MPRTSLPLTPPSSSPPRPPTRGLGSQPQPLPPTFYKADEYMVQRYPGFKPMTEAELHGSIKMAFQATDENLHTYIDAINKRVEEMIAGPGIRTMGVKPQSDDKTFFVRIPDSEYAIRMWDGGMDFYRQFCLDFYDTRRQIPVNLPEGFALWSSPSNVQGMYTMSGPLVSWERAMDCKDFPDGEEKWSVPEGMHITLVRADRPETFTFMVPVRQSAYAVPVQPQYGNL
ncbi:hypothetical protein BD309DRAFT_996356 [Dichomitus squalens]|uniref:Uncharacterized protein n=1 Tax=Dichomitus squalens TaxID=114155 RepID=A0A4Q9QEN2_9APHY|nr:uncharacterized protein DICSQDRAFT_179844 [Dichomitus squalens LYAD-421 SS1]EJF62493.1 hypothetical protein DICSQDRAFT_179844 [Dichomitus squalens LYAD-421 SS1]TBU50174.1 hypothetical protein BD309DRAFT_996356 [Dichomitus squalens]TBU66195.1 hypothetical protein BD310DRAFT_963756 [Dichomitus squalens]